MWRDALQSLREAHPELAKWLGDRVDLLQVPAVGLSLMTHLAILVAFASITYTINAPAQPTIRAELAGAALPDMSKVDDTTAIAATDGATTMEATAGSFAPSVSAVIVTNPSTETIPLEAIKPESRSAARVILPTATRLDQAVSIRGSGSEHVGGVEGAVDRLAIETLRQLERGPTLVVWAFDASGSLVAERERLSKHIQQVYNHIREYDRDGRTSQDGLLTLVAAFGQDRRLMTSEPTADPQSIASAINAVPLDESGFESTFTTVAEIARRWGKFKHDGKAYNVMTIVVTDEVGDDQDKLEDAIRAANAAKMPVYVLGSPALFGRADGHMDYKHPKTGQVYHNLPVTQGPESVAIEQVRIPFWYDGPQYDVMDAGFGPYALSRLAGATGGIYFVTRMGPNRLTFDPAGMREYKPDWVSKAQYLAAVDPATHPIRYAVMQAGLMTQQNLPGQPGLTFPAVESPQFKADMERNQITVARIAFTVDQAPAPISQAAKFRDRETSRRWQAHYDLARGRLLAMKLRCYEYNWACAKMKKDAPKFSQPGSNAWRLVPDTEVHYSDKAAAAANEARTLLQRVINDHPGTPWAVLAERELKDPFGFKWVEANVPPPPKEGMGGDAAAAKRKKKEPPKPPAKPPELPKL